MQSSILSREARKVRIPTVERVELARKRQGEEYWCIAPKSLFKDSPCGWSLFAFLLTERSDAVTTTASAVAEGMRATKFCKHCGEKIDADAKFCPSCGKEQ